MKCHYRIGDNPWIKGHIDSFDGNRMISFHSRDANNSVVNQISIAVSGTSFQFYDPYFVVCGYEELPDQKPQKHYKLTLVTVSPGWINPKN